jgi:hypothetical protein
MPSPEHVHCDGPILDLGALLGALDCDAGGQVSDAHACRQGPGGVTFVRRRDMWQVV